MSDEDTLLPPKKSLTVVEKLGYGFGEICTCSSAKFEI